MVFVCPPLPQVRVAALGGGVGDGVLWCLYAVAALGGGVGDGVLWCLYALPFPK